MAACRLSAQEVGELLVDGAALLDAGGDDIIEAAGHTS